MPFQKLVMRFAPHLCTASSPRRARPPTPAKRIRTVARVPHPLYMSPDLKEKAMPAHPLAHRTAIKMNGLGNEIVVLDLRGRDDTVRAEDARAIGRIPGLAFDQLMVIGDAVQPDHAGRLSIFNIDGSRAESCGNGTRCVAAVLVRDRPAARLALESDAGLLDVVVHGGGRFTVDMGAPHFGWQDIPLAAPASDTRGVALVPPVGGAPETFAAVNMGNPHAVFFVADAAAIDLARLGPAIETHPLFPARVNVSFAQRLAPDHIRLRVWERGAGATKACGSAACATLVAAARAGLTGRSATVTLPGGDLSIEWREQDSHVLMTGPTEFEFETPLDPALLPLPA
jgi:diaminopimelate epimerase